METTKTTQVKPSTPKVESPTPSYMVVDPVTEKELPSFPSTPQAACRNLETYLNLLDTQGYAFLGTVAQKVGRDTRNLMVFRKKK